MLSELAGADAIIYGMGSLYTSIAPSLVLRGVGEAVAERRCPKVGGMGVVHLPRAFTRGQALQPLLLHVITPAQLGAASPPLHRSSC